MKKQQLFLMCNGIRWVFKMTTLGHSINFSREPVGLGKRICYPNDVTGSATRNSTAKTEMITTIRRQ